MQLEVMLFINHCPISAADQASVCTEPLGCCSFCALFSDAANAFGMSSHTIAGNQAGGNSQNLNSAAMSHVCSAVQGC